MKIYLLNNFFSQHQERLSLQNTTKYSFTFISLITPFLTNNLRLIEGATLTKKKALLKQSYMFLTWFYYLTFSVDLNQLRATKNKIQIAILPTYSRKFTLTKAPMAHKNRSKEQYKFKFYKFSISFITSLKDEYNLVSANAGLLFALLSKKNFPVFESNLLFLKTCKLFFFLKDLNYFTYKASLLKTKNLKTIK